MSTGVDAWVSVGDSWIVVRAEDPERVVKALPSARGGGRTLMLRQVFDRALRHETTVVVPPRDGWILVVPGLVSPEALTTLSASLNTDVYAFEADDDHGCAIMYARAGTLVRDVYSCPAEGEVRDFGTPLEGEPDDLYADDVIAFAEAHSIKAAVDLGSQVLVAE
jgi:hypothetical protein